MAERAFGSFLLIYLCFVILFVLFEVASATIAPELRFEWARSGNQFRALLKDATSYYIAAQVGALSIISISIGIVTLIAQRQNARREIQVYYHESLAQEVVASCVALLVVLCLQIFWPAQALIRVVGLGTPSNNFESALTIIHTIWLVINLSALAYFVAVSLGFVQPYERENIRRRYTANWVIPDDLTKRLLRARYVGASLTLSSEDESNESPFIAFGYELGDSDHIELQDTFIHPVLLYDVRMKALAWVIQRWQHRCQLMRVDLNRRERRTASFRVDRPRLVFKPSFDRPLEGQVGWCTRHGGVPLTRLERFIVSWCFRFRRTDNET